MASAIDTMGNVGTIERMATSGGTTVAIDAIDGISTGYGRNVVCVANINRIGFLKGVTIGDLDEHIPTLVVPTDGAVDGWSVHSTMVIHIFFEM